MKFYFELQYLRFYRWTKSLGFHPIFMAILGLFAFLGLSKLLFYKTEFANWIYVGVAIIAVAQLSSSFRNEQLKLIFSTRKLRTIRLIENVAVSFPFIAYILYEKELMLGLSIFPIAIALVFLTAKRIIHTTIPTPFRKFPFEFIVGFRQYFWLFIIAYFLVFKGIQVDNFYLSVFGHGMIFLIAMLFYQKPESYYFVWIHKAQPTQFLLDKFKVSSICISMLSVVTLIALLVIYPFKWMILLAVHILGYIILGSIIVAKYSSYPNQMNVPQALFYALSLSFPPLLLVAIWVFYRKSIRRLEPIL